MGFSIKPRSAGFFNKTHGFFPTLAPRVGCNHIVGRVLEDECPEQELWAEEREVGADLPVAILRAEFWIVLKGGQSWGRGTSCHGGSVWQDGLDEGPVGEEENLLRLSPA